jgi:oxaloacetate decarboxylase (Na+ extruding) subunit gamma
MAVGSVLVEAAYLLLVGMSVVYGFLALMILTIKLVERLDKKWPESMQTSATNPQVTSRTTLPLQTDESATIVAAITAAIHQHRQTH